MSLSLSELFTVKDTKAMLRKTRSIALTFKITGPFHNSLIFAALFVFNFINAQNVYRAPSCITRGLNRVLMKLPKLAL